MKTYALYSLSLFTIWLLSAGGLLHAVDGTWISSRTGSQQWGATGNWVDGQVALGEGAVATLQGNVAVNISWGSGVSRDLGEIHVLGSNLISISGSGTINLDQGDGGMAVMDISSGGLNMGSNVVLAGSHGLEKRGAGRLYLTGVTLTGEILLSEGALATVNALGANTTVVFNGEGTSWQVSGSDPYVNNVILRGADGIITGASSDATLSGRILQDPEAEVARNLTYVNSAGGATNVKRFIVTGDNDYSGNTTIGGSTASITIVRISHDNAFGAGASDVVITGPASQDHNTLELEGGIVIAGKFLTLNGRGQGVAGSFRSLSGDNEWTGNVSLGTIDNARIGVDADRLVISGEISGSTSGGLIKVGDGILELANANSYTTGTNVIRGIVHVNHNQGLGTGIVELRNDSVLSIGEDIQAELSSLAFIGNNGQALSFDLGGNAESSLWVSGDQTGSGTYLVNIYNAEEITMGDYVLMTVSGSTAASAFILGEYSGVHPATLDWSEGVLSLQVIPEPQTALLVIGGMLALLIGWRRVKG